MREPPFARGRAWRVLPPMLLVLCGEALGVGLLRLSGPQPLAVLLLGGLVIACAVGYAGGLALDRLAGPVLPVEDWQAAQAARQGLEAALAARAEQQRRMRHDIRGVLSPVMLTADRLVNHADPAVKRSGDILLRTVDRATALLAESAEDVNPPADP